MITRLSRFNTISRARFRRVCTFILYMVCTFIFYALFVAQAQTNGYTFAGVADWDRDGKQDIVAKDSTGLLWLYPGESTRMMSQQERVQIGNGW